MSSSEVHPVSQDLSIAGKRAGLAGERSGLFMEQIRVVKELRDADRLRGRTGQLIRPRYMVWENVPGAFSSNGGEDFRAVLEETIRVACPDAPDIPFSRGGGGPWRTPGTEADGPLPTEFSMHSFGERPSAAVESRLSQILEDNPLPKYSLSGKACAGIRRRAETAGRKLPPELDEALEKQEHSA